MEINTSIPADQFINRTSKEIKPSEVLSLVAGLFGKDAAEKFERELFSAKRSKYLVPIIWPGF